MAQGRHATQWIGLSMALLRFIPVVRKVPRDARPRSGSRSGRAEHPGLQWFPRPGTGAEHSRATLGETSPPPIGRASSRTGRYRYTDFWMSNVYERHSQSTSMRGTRRALRHDETWYNAGSSSFLNARHRCVGGDSPRAPKKPIPRGHSLRTSLGMVRRGAVQSPVPFWMVRKGLRRPSPSIRLPFMTESARGMAGRWGRSTSFPPSLLGPPRWAAVGHSAFFLLLQLPPHRRT